MGDSLSYLDILLINVVFLLFSFLFFQMEWHLSDKCPMTEIICPYAKAGCPFQVRTELSI